MEYEGLSLTRRGEEQEGGMRESNTDENRFNIRDEITGTATERTLSSGIQCQDTKARERDCAIAGPSRI